ncbi:hypothetical protein PR202_ga29733 [Eleusine coracana subsp. coracana]|uniref:Gnk2-homologous domain-containing protein n=1 Tax=Eleusine coracana subsp. coracana TaxID=191504 RepID=A0AAV5DKF1_ELECO|nr:hypothetical protein PR202_ga29733 [Eleusine coracana subsp. coracana]
MLLVYLLLLSSSKTLARGQSFCSNANIMCMPSRTYMSSIISLADLLISKVRDSNLHSAIGTAGTGPNKVYGGVLCRGDTTPGNDCASRLSEVLEAAINNSARSSCSSQNNVILFQDGYQAQLIFSDQDFTSNAPDCIVRANLNPPPVGDANCEQFDNLVSKMMHKFTDVAASKTERYVTGQGWLTETRKTVYGLVQCTEDMSEEHCQDCLNGIITNRTKMVGHGQLGGAILGLRCSLWYQTDVQFFTGEPMLSVNMPTSIVILYIQITILLHPLSGYISPEYAFDGVCSVKSDVFSFGVLVLEIISGKRTAGFYPYDGKLYNLISYVSRSNSQIA